jgi:hypothetical protein
MMQSLKWDDGTVYFGDVEGMIPNGTGTAFYVNGDVYFGKWSKGEPQGKGVFKSKNGIYFGSFEKGKLIKYNFPK